MTTKKTVTLGLVGTDGNALSLIGAFRRQARLEGWTAEEIAAVTAKATEGDYNHLLRTLLDVCVSPDDDGGDFGDDDDEWRMI